MPSMLDHCLRGVIPSRGFSCTPRGQSGDERRQAPSEPAAEPRVSPINIPNALTLTRILATPVFVHWINLGHYDHVLGGFFAAAITDFFDGYLARKWKQITAVGSFMDPLADKVLVNGLAVPLAMQDQFTQEAELRCISSTYRRLCDTNVDRRLSRPP